MVGGFGTFGWKYTETSEEILVSATLSVKELSTGLNLRTVTNLYEDVGFIDYHLIPLKLIWLYGPRIRSINLNFFN